MCVCWAHFVPAFQRVLPPLHQVALTDTRDAEVQGGARNRVHVQMLQVVHHLPVMSLTERKQKNTFRNIFTFFTESKTFSKGWCSPASSVWRSRCCCSVSGRVCGCWPGICPGRWPLIGCCSEVEDTPVGPSVQCEEEEVSAWRFQVRTCLMAKYVGLQKVNKRSYYEMSLMSF